MAWRLIPTCVTVAERSSAAQPRAKTHEQLTAVVQGRAPARDDRTWRQTGRRRDAGEAGVLGQGSGRLSPERKRKMWFAEDALHVNGRSCTR